MEEITLKLEELARLTGKNATELKTGLTNAETGEPLPEEEQRNFINAAFSSKFSNIQEDSRKRGMREGLKNFEKKTAQAYGVESYTDATDLVGKVVAKSGKIDDKEILKNPAVVAKINEARAEVEAIKAQTAAKIAEAAAAANKAQNKTKVLNLISGLNLALSSDEKRKQQQINHLAASIMSGLKTETADDGKTYVLGADGSRVRENFADVTLGAYVKNFALNIYDVAKPSGGAPGFQGGNGGGGTVQFTRQQIEDRNEYVKKRKELRKANDKAGEQALFEAREKYLNKKK